MSPRTILTLSNGRGIDLLEPRSADIDFTVIAEHLSKENRYNGATKDLVYSVAEHCGRGVAAIMAATGDRALAAYFLLHDGHEAFLKDDTTPKKAALAFIANASFGIVAGKIVETFHLLTYRVDCAIHEAAGLPWPPSSDMQARIKHWDLRMFVTEWRDLMGGQAHPDWARYADSEPLPVKIRPWDWHVARNVFLENCRDLLPALQNAGAA